MKRETYDKITEFTARVYAMSVETELHWDEIVFALGLTTAALASLSARNEGASRDEKYAHAKKQFEAGMAALTHEEKPILND